MQAQADIYLGWYRINYESGQIRAVPNLEAIAASFQDNKLVDEHIRQMCTRIFGIPIAAKQDLTDQQYEMVREIINMRTGTDGAQMMSAHAAILEEFDDIVRAPGSRRERAPPGPSQRRESGEDPTDHGRWWQDRHNKGGRKGAATGKSKGGSQNYGGESGVLRSPASVRWDVLAHWSRMGMAELSLVMYLCLRR